MILFFIKKIHLLVISKNKKEHITFRKSGVKKQV